MKEAIILYNGNSSQHVKVEDGFIHDGVVEFRVGDDPSLVIIPLVAICSIVIPEEKK